MYSEDWQALGDVQYRKWEYYSSMAWDGGGPDGKTSTLDDYQVGGGGG